MSTHKCLWLSKIALQSCQSKFCTTFNRMQMVFTSLCFALNDVFELCKREIVPRGLWIGSALELTYPWRPLQKFSVKKRQIDGLKQRLGLNCFLADNWVHTRPLVLAWGLFVMNRHLKLINARNIFPSIRLSAFVDNCSI